MSYKIKILMSTYNGEKYLEEQLDSIFSQSEKNFELIIRDDGSTDNTKNILEKYSKKYFGKISIIYGENKGAKESFFELINNVELNSEYYSFADQDDVWLKFKIERAIQKIEDKINEEYKSIVYCSNFMFVNEKLDYLRVGHKNIENYDLSLRNSILQSMMLGCTIVFSKEFLIHLRKKEIENKKIIMHDCWCYLIASKFSKIIYDSKVTMLYRQHGRNVSANQLSFFQRLKNMKRRLDKNGLLTKKREVKHFFDLYYKELSQNEKKNIIYYLGSKTIVERALNLLKKRIVINGVRKVTKISGWFSYLFFNA